MNIQDKAKKLVAIRKTIDEMKKNLDPLMQQKEELQSEIMNDLKTAGFKSIKTEEATISRMISQSLMIIDEKLLIKDLKKRKLTDYVKEQIDRSIWLPFSKQTIKEGIKLAGVELRETEYISVRSNVKDVNVEDSGSGKDE